ncbi:MAG: hypothetical protein LBI53_00175 [Candidatus Peribacteria bacterium]|jgi:hypothetical protein|nr:hypothetical protein [Candidatus Peribacteria bacterium]
MPEVIISYNPEGPNLTLEDVISTITFTGKVSPNLTITNNGGNTDRTFARNGNFIYTYNNGWGTYGSAKATVDWINFRPGFRPFITTWRTTNAGETLVIPLYNGTNYNFDIDW